MLLKNRILLALTLLTFMTLVDIAASMALIALLSPLVRKYLNNLIIQPADISDFRQRYARHKIHYKEFSTCGDVYSSTQTSFSHPHQEIGHDNLKSFTENYFSPNNIKLLLKKRFIYSDQCAEINRNWAHIQARGGTELLLSSVALLATNALRSFNNMTCLLLTSNLALLFILLVPLTPIKYILILGLLQTIAKAAILYKHIGGVVSPNFRGPVAYNPALDSIEEQKALELNSWVINNTMDLPNYFPTTRAFPNYFPTRKIVYDRRPLVLIEYENFPHWCVSYLLSTKEGKALIDQDLSDPDYDLQRDNWKKYLDNCLASDQRSSINGKTFICPYGKSYKFLTNKKYLNSALTYLNFTLVPTIIHE